ncbi:hypothetical protein Y1Q_0020984 [Alligator mississippiensis]|uniref:Uncharacterized protein n=1 Tax=Alligator mississippiensis TaxID=8496 RepID=A0A151MTM1_ALLMI|nr:hypothetical protein Y1Q_0020984 [Alligator mississippiensis]
MFRGTSFASCSLCLKTMGGSGSTTKPTSVQPSPLLTTTTSTPTPATVITTTSAPVPTAGAKSFFDDHEVLYLLLSFLAGALLATLVFTVIWLIIGQRKKKYHKRCQEASLQKDAVQSTQQADVGHAQEKPPQDEVSYASLTFKKTSKSVAEK